MSEDSENHSYTVQKSYWEGGLGSLSGATEKRGERTG